MRPGGLPPPPAVEVGLCGPEGPSGKLRLGGPGVSVQRLPARPPGGPGIPVKASEPFPNSSRVCPPDLQVARASSSRRRPSKPPGRAAPPDLQICSFGAAVQHPSGAPAVCPRPAATKAVAAPRWRQWRLRQWQRPRGDGGCGSGGGPVAAAVAAAAVAAAPRRWRLRQWRQARGGDGCSSGSGPVAAAAVFTLAMTAPCWYTCCAHPCELPQLFVPKP